MNAPIHPPRFIHAPARPPRRDAFALVITLLILSLLVVVAVSYLSSMVGERQTADAYTSKTRAEEMAQAGADSAVAILKQSFRDFPDSATVWDTAQSTNADGSNPNEGTSLYLRAVPDGNYANPFPAGISAAANDAGGNNPGNPACKNFVLPLVSGVPGGRAQLVSNKANIFTATMDAKKDNFTDLNVRRGSGDTQGVIGSPPGWGQSYPKPARAYWVPLKSKVTDTSGNVVDGPVTGRYAFWVEDESFRANSNYFNDGTAPQDNSQQFKDSTGNPRSIAPTDPMLLGPLTLGNDASPPTDAQTIRATRLLYPGDFFPDPLAFVHTSSNGASAFTTAQTDLLRYLLTNQSGTLNLTRHGTQRLNLNAVIPQTAPGAGPGKNLLTQVTQIVQTLKFHLPYLGERFYRLAAPSNLNATILNNATQVPGSPKTDAIAVGSDHSEIYYWKVAANIEDYVDTDAQPTIIAAGGTLKTLPAQVESLNADQANSSSEIWAQGKESAPFLQEAAVRYRPIVHDHAPGATKPYNYDLYIDYYLEFWNMTDHDVYASQPSDPLLATQPSLSGAKVHISGQQPWQTYPTHGVLYCDPGQSTTLYRMGPDADIDIDLTNGVFQSVNNGLQAAPYGVVFKAGACTVITTDPDLANYVFKGLSGTSNSISTTKMPAPGVKPSSNLATTYYCSNLVGNRHYTGKTDNGLWTAFRDNYYNGLYHEDDQVHVALYNGNGYIDSSSCAISEHNGDQYTNTDKFVNQTTGGTYNDYSYSSCLFGNLTDPELHFPITPSQLGDPRTNNEQLSLTQSYDSAKSSDQSRFLYGNTSDTTLGYPNGPSQKPEQTMSSSPQGYPWPDYYSLPLGTNYPAPDATTAPMIIADSALTSIGQLGDVFDPARLPNMSLPNGILYSRGGGRTFKIGQHDDLYSYDPTGSANTSNNPLNDVSASSGWASWRLADIFDAADKNNDPIELPARVNINGVLRDKGAALLALLQGFTFQGLTTTDKKGQTNKNTDPVIHGDGHIVSGSSSLATQSLDTTTTAPPAPANPVGFAALIKQITDRLNSSSPASGPAGPFFERGELGEIGSGATALFGANPASAFALGNKLLVGNVDMNKTFDHGREELFRRIAEMICTRGDTFTIYTVGQSISQPTATAPMKVTGTHRMRVTCRLVPKAVDPVKGGYKDFHPGYDLDLQTGAFTPKTDYNNFGDPSPTGRFAKPDHYDVQILQTSVY